MLKIMYSILVLIIFVLFVQQTVSSQSLKRCRRATTSSCVLTPELTEGPYYWNTSAMRQNISEDRAGIQFRLQVVVMNVNTCQPISNAAVTVWHCDALGIYSHYIQASQNVQNPKNDNSTFLRGIQLTNASGIATFDTIYPGWYVGRATHMHIKVHLGGTYISANSYYSGASYVHTGQLFFNDSLSDLVNQQSPYNTKSTNGSRLQNSGDHIYASGGSYTLMNVQYVNSAKGMSGGLITSVTLGVTSSSSTSTTAKASTTTTKKQATTTTTKKATTNTTKKVTTTPSRQVNQNIPGGQPGGQPGFKG